VVLLAACSAVTVVVFFLALWLLPFAFPRFPGFQVREIRALLQKGRERSSTSQTEK